ncbi:hypothetical protein GGR50DRAFT_616432 [Xylaria sp. CBS 124048]|nr:hypothetical protein GGR50DRAFT_616432 [Xylaria sp. CBS 124048]
MADSTDGPPILRPVPIRPFNVKLRESTPPEEESSLPHTPLPGSSVNLEWLNYKLNARPRVRSDSSGSISRAQSVMNLTSSTLMGIYEPTNYAGDRYASGNEVNSPWEAGPERPMKLLSVDDSTDIIQKERAYPPRRHSVMHHPPPPPPITTTSLFYSGLRALLLAGLGVIYGIGVATVRESRPAAGSFTMGHIISTSGYDWGYMTFWGASGLIMGCLLPWVDNLWERSFGKQISGDMVETEGDANNSGRPKTDWTLAVRGIGIFIGIAYAIRKLPWDSTLQVSLSLAFVNPVLWFLIDRSMPGFVVSSVVGLTGSALLTSLQPDMVPVPAILSSFPAPPAGLDSASAIHPNASAHYVDASSMMLGGLASQQTLAMGIWTLNVLFCCAVVFGNVGRWLAINKYGTTHG